MCESAACCPTQAWWLYLDDPQLGVEASHICGVARNDGVIAPASVDRDAGVDRVVSVSLTTKDPDRLGGRFVKDRHRDVGEAKRPGHAGLTRARPPCLGERSGGYVDGQTGCVGLVKQSLHPPIGSFDGDQCSGVERYARH
jgi:hypothetical protein